MIEDSDYSASESRRAAESYERVVFRPKSIKKTKRKYKGFMVFSSFMLMLSLSFTFYLHHYDIILNPFQWVILQLISFILFFLLGISVAFINVCPDFQD